MARALESDVPGDAGSVHQSQRFAGLTWKDLNHFGTWVDSKGRTLVWTKVLWSHTKGLRTGMTLKDLNAITPETSVDPIELQACTCE